MVPFLVGRVVRQAHRVLVLCKTHLAAPDSKTGRGKCIRAREYEHFDLRATKAKEHTETSSFETAGIDNEESALLGLQKRKTNILPADKCTRLPTATPLAMCAIDIFTELKLRLSCLANLGNPWPTQPGRAELSCREERLEVPQWPQKSQARIAMPPARTL